MFYTQILFDRRTRRYGLGSEFGNKSATRCFTLLSRNISLNAPPEQYNINGCSCAETLATIHRTTAVVYGRSRELKIVSNFQYDTKLVARGSWERETAATTISGRRRKAGAPPVVTKSFQWNYVSIADYTRPLTGRARINNTTECCVQGAETITCEKERIEKKRNSFDD